jgi:hypothetical protein
MLLKVVAPGHWQRRKLKAADLAPEESSGQLRGGTLEKGLLRMISTP